MKSLIRWAALAAFLVAGVWAVRSQGWDAYAAAASALVVPLGTFVPVPFSTVQSQKVGSHSVGIQGGRDVTVGDIEKK